MCKYCESDYEVNLLSAKENDADVKMFKNRIWLEAYSFFDDPLNDYEEIEINFCPMCGRKLSNKENWIKCDSELVRVSLDNKTNDIFKVRCMARGIEGEVCAYSVNINNQYEYCILKDNEYIWLNDNGYCKFFKKKVQ